MAVECLSVNLARICANQGSFTGGGRRVSGFRGEADRQFPAADHQPSSAVNLGQVCSLAAMETAVRWWERVLV